MEHPSCLRLMLSRRFRERRHAACTKSLRKHPRITGPFRSPLIHYVSLEVMAMMDIVFVSVTIAFFGLSWAYITACDRL